MGGRGRRSRGKGGLLKGHPAERARRRRRRRGEERRRLKKPFTPSGRRPFWREKAENWEAAEVGAAASRGR